MNTDDPLTAESWPPPGNADEATADTRELSGMEILQFHPDDHDQDTSSPGDAADDLGDLDDAADSEDSDA